LRVLLLEGAVEIQLDGTMQVKKFDALIVVGAEELLGEFGPTVVQYTHEARHHFFPADFARLAS
jgi:hypothetical protein